MKTIVVHDGPFQADEVFAVAFLIMYYPGLQIDMKSLMARDDYPFDLIRTRDEDIIAKADIVCDVGGKYNTHALRFDHHQFQKPEGQDYVIPKGLHGTWHEDMRITPSACGLVLDYLWYYHESKNTGDLPIHLVNRFFKRLVIGIDAIDNGMSQVSRSDSLRYRPCTISNIIAHYNSDDAFSEEQDDHFAQAVDVALFHLRYIDSGYWRDEFNFETFKETINSQSGDHLVLEQWYPSLMNMVSRANALKKYKRIIWPQLDGKGKQEYRVQVPPKDPGSFELGAPPLDGSKVNPKFPDGHKTEGDLVFVHSGKWIGATRTMEAAYKL